MKHLLLITALFFSINSFAQDDAPPTEQDLEMYEVPREAMTQEQQDAAPASGVKFYHQLPFSYLQYLGSRVKQWIAPHWKAYQDRVKAGYSNGFMVYDDGIIYPEN